MKKRIAWYPWCQTWRYVWQRLIEWELKLWPHRHLMAWPLAVTQVSTMSPLLTLGTRAPATKPEKNAQFEQWRPSSSMGSAHCWKRLACTHDEIDRLWRRQRSAEENPDVYHDEQNRFEFDLMDLILNYRTISVEPVAGAISHQESQLGDVEMLRFIWPLSGNNSVEVNWSLSTKIESWKQRERVRSPY